MASTQRRGIPSANTAELALPGRWCYSLQGGWRKHEVCVLGVYLLLDFGELYFNLLGRDGAGNA